MPKFQIDRPRKNRSGLPVVIAILLVAGVVSLGAQMMTSLNSPPLQYARAGELASKPQALKDSPFPARDDGAAAHVSGQEEQEQEQGKVKGEQGEGRHQQEPPQSPPASPPGAPPAPTPEAGSDKDIMATPAAPDQFICVDNVGDEGDCDPNNNGWH